MTTAIKLCSEALLSLGAASIASFEEGSAEAEVASNRYATIRDAMLTCWPWNFARAQTTLARLVATPVADFANAFQLPDDYLRARSVGVDTRGRGVPYRIAERRLHCDLDAVVLTYTFRPPEEAFPPFFREALIARLAAAFCIPVTDNTSRAEAVRAIAKEQLSEARRANAQEEPPTAFEDFTLLSVRG